ncbi:hypothetical protein QGN32_11390 [Mycolicibacterium sp. ND9-15]|uniref:hypothetical protein n=1 Tax=Mycolicibacterium sp. ND9-15 TaxID=3042320 RepID=UPI002DD9E81D|nr:hypothetical protein [Mycolicibacterium sp. ND9-15]WSE58405.1 hypothetical protein QGN32_11390 [Mycolicibacterium sp. ND9-15]
MTPTMTQSITTSLQIGAMTPLNGPYAASKAGVWALCDATRLEGYATMASGVGSMHPTFVKTP